MIAIIASAILLQTPANLTASEVKAGWKLLFDGKSTKGWHNSNETGVASGWTIKDGVLYCADPHKAGDIITDDQYQWFELSVDVNIGKGQNSGIMYHVADTGDATWHSGPEIQIYDHPFEKGVETTGFLYQLYDAPKDASKPAGEWNNIHIMISPKKCWTEVNGVRYYEYVLGSEDFKARVKKSKFSEFPEFGVLGKGHIAIQGDHGRVAFKNMKIRTIKAGN